MSQDMMQALSGSSLLSLSVGTLPAVKSGMMLDANPFASQLAQMTGPEVAMGGTDPAAAPMVGGTDANFALALAQATVPTARTPAAAAPFGTQLTDLADIQALPADASPSQIIEAVLGGAMQPAAGPASALVVAPAPGTQAAAAPAAPLGTAPEVQPEALAAAVAADEIAPEPHTARPRRAVKLDQPVAAAAEAAPVAAPVIDPATPASVRPEADAPDAGSVRVAISAKPSLTDVAGPAADIGGTVPANASAPDAAPIPLTTQAPSAQPMASRQPVSPTWAAPAPLEAPRADAAPVATDSPSQTLAPASALAAPLASDALRPAAAPVVASAAAPIDPVQTETGISDSGTGDSDTGGSDTADIGLADIGTGETAVTAQARPAPSVTRPAPVMPNPVASDPATATAPEAGALPDPAATTAIAGSVQTPAQPLRTTPAARTGLSAAGQRAIMAASQGARPAQALSALFDLADPSAQLPAATLGDVTGLDALAAAPTEAIPPSWAAALNAVVSPSVTNAALGLNAATATGATPQAQQLETLAFDASFVGNIESQIARVVGGDQMVRMQIMPEHLGRIDIEMLAGPDRDQVRITTEHDAVRDTLVQSQVRLEQDLRSSTQRNADVTVELRQQSAGAQGGSAQQQRGQSGADAGAARTATQRPSASDASTPSQTAQSRPRDNVRYA